MKSKKLKARPVAPRRIEPKPTPVTPRNGSIIPLFIVPRTDEVTGHYFSWFQARGLPPPVPSLDGIFIGCDGGLICGAMLDPTQGPYLFAEHLATNPQAPVRLRHRAVSLLIRTLRAYSAITSKYAMVIIRSGSLIRILSREGFSAQSAVVMTTNPVCAL